MIKNGAASEIRTRTICLEGRYTSHYTNAADEEIVYYTIFVLILIELNALLDFHKHFYSISLRLTMIFDFHHLNKANINFFSHGVRVIKVSMILIVLGIIGIIHALFPFIFVETVSNGVKKIADEMSHF